MAADPKNLFADKTSNRRTLLKWLGQGAVLCLSGSWLSSCASGREVDGEADGCNLLDLSESPGFPFQPGEGSLSNLKNFGERTVDPQDLQEILRTWTLKVDGLVESPKVYGFADLVAMKRTDQCTDFHCVEGWSVYDVPWNGVHLSKIFEQVKPTSTATHLTLHTIGSSYNESIPIEVALEYKTILAYGISGNTIPFKHGFPLRLVVPRLLGYKNAKFIERIELIDKSVEGYWVNAGYPYAGEVPASRLRPGKY